MSGTTAVNPVEFWKTAKKLQLKDLKWTFVPKGTPFSHTGVNYNDNGAEVGMIFSPSLMMRG